MLALCFQSNSKESLQAWKKNKEQTDSDQRGGGRGIMGETRGRGKKRNLNKGTDTGEDWLWEWGDGVGVSSGEKARQL